MSILPILPVPPTQYTLGEGGAGVQQQAGYRVPHAREDGAPAPWMLQQSEGGPLGWEKGIGPPPLVLWGRGGQYLSQPGAPPLVSYLQLLE